MNLVSITFEIRRNIANFTQLIISLVSRARPSLQNVILALRCFRKDGEQVESLGGLDRDLLAHALEGFRGIVTIRLRHPCQWDRAHLLSLEVLSRAVHLRLDYGEARLYAEIPRDRTGHALRTRIEAISTATSSTICNDVITLEAA